MFLTATARPPTWRRRGRAPTAAPRVCRVISVFALSVLRHHLQLELVLYLYDGLLKTLCCSCEYYQPLVHACWRAYLYLSLLFVCCLHRFAPNDKTTTTTHTQHTTQHNTHKHTHCSQSACSAVQCSVLGRGGTSSRAKESKKCVWATRWRMESVVCCWGTDSYPESTLMKDKNGGVRRKSERNGATWNEGHCVVEDMLMWND